MSVDPIREQARRKVERMKAARAEREAQQPTSPVHVTKTKDIAEKKDEPKKNELDDWQLLSEVEMRSIVFADKPLLQADAFHLVAGRKGCGKGTFLSGTAARVIAGELGAKDKVLWIGTEDSASIDIRPRIEAAGGDPGKVVIPKGIWIQLPRDFELLGRVIARYGNVGMVCVDPLGNHITGKDSNSETDIRDALAPLNTLADTHKCMVFGVRHVSEKEARQGTLSAILGSSAWVQIPRVVLAVAKDNDDPNVVHVQCVAGNRLPPESSGRMFRIEGVMLPGLKEEVTRSVWIGDSTKDVDTLLADGNNRQVSKSAAARELILDIIEGEGEQESDALDARVAREVGIGAATARNIRSKMNKESGLIKNVPEKDEHGQVLRWKVVRTAAPRSS